MAKNLGRKFATMSDDERRRFALEEEAGTSDHPAELEFGEARNEDNIDPEHRDGMSALLDDEQHQRAVQKESKRQRKGRPDTE